MKNTRKTILALFTLAVLFFTLGVFTGRNFSGSEVSFSFPEQMSKRPTEATASQHTASVSEDSASVPLIDLNSASYEDLLTLPGIGEGLALEILSYRASSGGFSHVEELMNVPGIGETRMESMLHLITIGGNS